MVLLQKLPAHTQVYVDGKLLNLEKAPGRQVVSVLFSTKEGGKRNEMKYFLLWLKCWSARGASPHPAVMGNCPTISRWFYQVDEFLFIFLFLVLLMEMKTRCHSNISSCCLV